MNHPDDATLQTFHDGALSTAELHVVESHLAACGSCAAKREGLRAMAHGMELWSDTVAMHDDLGDAIFAKINASASLKLPVAEVVPIERAHELRTRRGSSLRRVAMPTIAIAAAAAVALWVGTRAPATHDTPAPHEIAQQPVAPGLEPVSVGGGAGGAEVVRIDVQGAQSYAVLSVPGVNPGAMTAVVWIQDSPEESPPSATQ
jgi:anti-sigma factor RsiW